MYSASPGPSRSPRTSTSPDLFAVFAEFEAYPFSSDPEFKAGLPTVIAAIRGQKRSAAQIDEMIGRAQWFYFTRMKSLTIPWEAYASTSHALQPLPCSSSSSSSPSRSSGSHTAHSNSDPNSTSHTPAHDALAQLNSLAEARTMMTSDGGADQGMSFEMLCRLISEGRAGEVPVQEIPDELNTSPPSLPSLSPRPKPWETNLTVPPNQPFAYNAYIPSPAGSSNNLSLSQTYLPSPVPYNPSPQFWAQAQAQPTTTTTTSYPARSSSGDSSSAASHSPNHTVQPLSAAGFSNPTLPTFPQSAFSPAEYGEDAVVEMHQGGGDVGRGGGGGGGGSGGSPWVSHAAAEGGEVEGWYMGGMGGARDR